jgi:hypothetical protein
MKELVALENGEAMAGVNNDCDCSERFIVREDDNGDLLRERLPKPEFSRCHNCEYVRSRNSNIPQAAELAESRAGDPADPDYAYRWTREFVLALDELYELNQKKQ